MILRKEQKENRFAGVELQNVIVATRLQMG
jgi:hypothetical protein